MGLFIDGEYHAESVADSVCLNSAKLFWQRNVEYYVPFFVESITATTNNQGISCNSFFFSTSGNNQLSVVTQITFYLQFYSEISIL